MEDPKNINQGGINGLGKGIVDTHDDSFIALQAMIEASFKKQSEAEKLKNAMIKAMSKLYLKNLYILFNSLSIF